MQHIGIAAKLIALAGVRIEDLDRVAVVVGGLAEIAAALGLGRHGGECVVGVAASRPVQPAKEEPLVAALEDLRNVQRTADFRHEPRLILVSLLCWNTYQRLRTWVQSR